MSADTPRTDERYEMLKELAETIDSLRVQLEQTEKERDAAIVERDKRGQRIAEMGAEIERLSGKWAEAGERCPQCGTGIAAHPMVERLRAALDKAIEFETREGSRATEATLRELRRALTTQDGTLP